MLEVALKERCVALTGTYAAAAVAVIAAYAALIAQQNADIAWWMAAAMALLAAIFYLVASSYRRKAMAYAGEETKKRMERIPADQSIAIAYNRGRSHFCMTQEETAISGMLPWYGEFRLVRKLKKARKRRLSGGALWWHTRSLW